MNLRIELPCTVDIDDVLEALLEEGDGLKPFHITKFLEDNKEWFIQEAGKQDIERLKKLIDKCQRKKAPGIPIGSGLLNTRLVIGEDK